jgi:hypothetical protein
MGFPHSDMPGSRPMCGSPGLIAAYRVLPRLVMPRHPSCARIRLAGPFRARAGLARLRCNLFSSQTMQLSKTDPPGGGGNRRDAQGAEAGPPPSRGMVGVPGVEPGTSSLSGTRSNLLSYTPGGWWRQPGSNRRHPACKAGALPTELCPRRAPGPLASRGKPRA